jgi:RNA polymerase sigma-70 factor, ECF subfamily
VRRGARPGTGAAVLDRAATGVEAHLLERLRAGDRGAAERFVREHAGWMLALAQRYVRDTGLAEDCVQEAFLQAFRGIGAFQGRSALKSWLYRILVNTALMKLRGRCLAEHPIERLPDGECSIARVCWVEPMTPYEILERKEACELVAAKMAELPDSYRIVLLLRDIEGMSTEETARMLATTQGAVKVRLHRARAAFRTLVAPVLERYV